jgi:hypothetical protein
VNAPEKAIEGSCSSSCLGRSFLASLATAQRAKSGLTAARPVSRSNGEGENHGHICLCQIISARDTAVCLRRFPELKQHQRRNETVLRASSQRQNSSPAMSLFPVDPKSRPWHSGFSLFFSSSIRRCLEKRRGSSPFTPAVVYPERLRALFHAPIP